jgi:hypothetical protein
VIDLEGAGEIEVVRAGADLVLQSRVTGARATVPAEALVAAWQGFDRRLAAYFASAVPELLQHREIGRWLRGEWPFVG